MTLITKQRADEAIAEYNAAYEAGGEIEYPVWADIVLKECDEAERLADKVVEMGGNVE